MDLAGIGTIVSGVGAVIDDLWVSEEEKMLAGAAQTNAQAQLTAAQAQAQANASAAELAAQNNKKQWETIQYGLLGAGALLVLVVAYKAAQG